MKILVTICARGGSKGIPGKNIKVINGKPLIDYTINTAIAFSNRFAHVDVVLSTDSDAIKKTVESSGNIVDCSYTRPDSLAQDTSGKIDAITDVLAYAESKNKCIYDYILDLDVTSPLRTVDDLQHALNKLIYDKDALNIFSVSPAARNPYFNMVEQAEDGYYKTSKTGRFLTRQSAPKVYEMNASFYFYTRKFFFLGLYSAITDRSLVYEVPHMCFDLDHPIDFILMSNLLENNQLDFEFQ